MQISKLGRLSVWAMVGAAALAAAALASDMAEVALRAPGDLKRLQEAGLDVTYISAGGMADVVIYDEDDRRELTALGLYWRISQPNLEQFFAGRLEPHRDDMGGYPTFREIVDHILTLHDDYPEIVSEPVVLGESIEGRSIWAVKISDNPDDDEEEPEILLTSLIHAREAITPMVLLRTMDRLVEGYGQDDRITRLVNDRETWFIPCINPDGYVYNEATNPNGGGMWRKNRRDNGDGTIGVDLNRNFADHWGFDNLGSDPRGREETYRGEGPFSEPETQVIRDFVNERSFALSIFFHSYGNLCLYPKGWAPVHAEDREAFAAVSANLTQDNRYWCGTGWETLYMTNGDSDDWLYAADNHEPILAMTVEVGTRQDNFWPSRNRIEPLIAENVPLCLNAIDIGGRVREAFQPMPPVDVVKWAPREGGLTVSWEAPDDQFNPPAAYDLMAQGELAPAVDTIALNLPRWTLLNAAVTGANPHSAPYSVRFTVNTPMATMTLNDPIMAPDTLWAWMRFQLTRDNNFAMEVSVDDFSWHAVPGRDAEDIIEEGYNHGPGYRGRSDGWERFWFDLRQWRNQRIKLRFRYYKFYGGGQADYCYIDDIGPLPRADWQALLGQRLRAREWRTNQDFADEVRFLVRSIDEDGQTSFWSRPAAVAGIPPRFTRPLDQGWSLVSSPVSPREPALEALLALWVERDILSIVKDDAGRFFSPRHQFDQIVQWDFRKAYWLKLDEGDTLRISGEYVPVNTPLPVRMGWNNVVFLPEDPMPAEQALDGVIDNLLFVRDMFGRFWSPRHNFNNLQDFRRGNGYQLRMASYDTLVYPLGGRLNAVPEPETAAPFTPLSPDCHNLIIESSSPLPEGVISAVNARGEAVGRSEVGQGMTRVGLALWAADSPEGIGMRPGEPFSLNWSNTASSAQTRMEFSAVEGPKVFETNALSVLRISGRSALPTKIELLSAFPNPFNAAANLLVQTSGAGDIDLKIYDVNGRVVQSFTRTGAAAGEHRFHWDAGGKPTGVYLVRAVVNHAGGAFRSELKLLLVR